MTLTRAVLHPVLWRRVGGWIDAVGSDYRATFDAQTTGYDDPLAFALRQCGVTPASAFSPVDADMVNLAAADTDKLLDLAEYRLMLSVWQNYTAVDISIGPHSERLDQLRAGLEAAIKAKGAFVRDTYGYGSVSSAALGTLSAGVIELDFQEPTPE